MDAMKIAANLEEYYDRLKHKMNQFDFIFDCSTDDDVAHLLDVLSLKAKTFNLSITNEARELVCVCSPNLYSWLKDIFSKFNFEVDNLYNPTGCWSPTFKASHNDIAVLVQYALKHINRFFEQNRPVRNFYLSTTSDGDFMIKLVQF